MVGSDPADAGDWTYIDLMVNTYGFDRTFLNAVDLDNQKIFAPHCLIFTVWDEHGQPVGFAAPRTGGRGDSEVWQRFAGSERKTRRRPGHR